MAPAIPLPKEAMVAAAPLEEVLLAPAPDPEPEVLLEPESVPVEDPDSVAEPVEEAPLASEKRVVLPTVLVMVSEPEVMVVTTASVV